jgi:tRNA dimethylallyltransferase
LIKPLLIVVAGPTASGKTDLAIALAQHYSTSILSADARQFYAEMHVGTAKPSTTQLQAAPHHFVGHISIHQHYNAGLYQAEATQQLEKLFKNNPVVVMVGGSGLYINAVIEGIDPMPAVTDGIRNEVMQFYNTKGLLPLQEWLKKIDPEYYKIVDLHNHTRIIRAIEVSLAANQPYTAFRNKKPAESYFNSLIVAPDWPRPVLYQRIDERVLQMIANGLQEEAATLYQHFHLKALQTVGYSEWKLFFEHQQSLASTIALIQQHTRNYAKRQLTWFRRQAPVHWLPPAEAFHACKNLVDKFI